MPQFNCDQSCKSGPCQCGAIDANGVVQDGGIVRASITIMDASPDRLMIRDNAERKTLTMMTDAVIKTMRDSVCTMTIDQAAALPIYDAYRGLFDDGGVPMERCRAMYDGAQPGEIKPTDQECRVQAHRDHMIEQMRDAHRTPYTCGGHVSPSVEQARAAMVADMANAHRAEQQSA
jgi:hypothetical protein